tara:strand:- start:441 stop:896 length:456 start_codon:yes stop_codon:yes gene_type:complete
MATTTKYGVHNLPHIEHLITSKITRNFGLGFPLGEILPGLNLTKKSGVELVKGNLRQLLLTNKGERIMLPEFGLGLRRYLFHPLDEELFENIKLHILSGIAKYMPQINILKISVINSEDVNLSGISGLIIKLVVQLKEDSNMIFDTIVEIK